MNRHVLNRLYENKINHAYVIKALEGSGYTAHFEFRHIEEPLLSYAAIWHDDNIVTLHGDKVWCEESFGQYLGYYSFYDIQPELMQALCTGADEKKLSHYDLEDHYLMKLDHKGIKKIIKTCKTLDAGNKCVKKAKTIQNTTRYQYLERDGRVLGSVLVEKATEGVFVISEMLIKKAFRNKGLATCFISRLVGDVLQETFTDENNEIILYVDKKNTPALKLYRKLGLMEMGVFQNLVHKDD